ncbi:V-type ATP synthase subunit F [Peptostreptococcaceae bacterium AGR-M142]
MKSYLISDNRDTALAFRLAGINNSIVHEESEIKRLFNKLLEDEDIGIIILTEIIMDKIKSEVEYVKRNRRKPLIIEIPDRHGSKRAEGNITKYIRDSVGIKI